MSGRVPLEEPANEELDCRGVCGCMSLLVALQVCQVFTNKLEALLLQCTIYMQINELDANFNY